MKIRTTVILVIVLTNLVIIALSISAGAVFVDYNNKQSLQTDLDLIANIADHYLSAEIESLFIKVSAVAELYSTVAENYGTADEPKRQDFLNEQIRKYPEFLGMAVYDAEARLIEQAGLSPAGPDAVGLVDRAYTEKTALSSTHQTSTGTYFYAAAGIPDGQNDILIVTLPGLYFTHLLSEFRIWETGHIFLTDREGYAVSNPREYWVHDRFNYITIADVDESYKDLAATIRLMVRGESGTGYYTITGSGFSDTPRVCVYRPVSGSAEGWSLGVVAPTMENPSRNTTGVLFLVGGIGLVLNIIFAIFASNIIKKPYEQVVILKNAAEKANTAKSNFLATMSHEIRSPLNVIIGITDLRMEDVTLPDDIKKDITKINNAGDVLLGIVNDILDISKIEAGKIDLTHTVYNTASVLNDIITLNMIRIASKPIKFVIEIDENLPEELHGDELRIKQIFNNLLSNAFKYTDAGSVTLKVSHSKDSGGRVWLDISVTDTGIGIRGADIDKLFTDYSQVDADANRRTGGTGLGLVITKRLAELMDGSVHVDSEYGVGSTFRVRVCQKSAGSSVLGPDTVKKLASFTFTDEKQHVSKRLVRDDMSYARVLIVDDYTSNLDVAAGMISKYKIQVDCVTTGKAAIDRIMNENPVYDAIFMDHMMPEMDGIEATQIIRKIGTGYASNIPIIALTANAVAGNESMFISKGFDAFLAKPIDLMELDAILRKWVRKKHAGPAMHRAEPLEIPADADAAGEGKDDISVDIPGVDASKLKAHYQNDPDIYLLALRAFPSNAAGAIEKMRAVTKDTLSGYAINAHGLKGVSANICAQDISLQAAELEILAKSGDISAVLRGNDAFLKNVSTLIGNVNAWFEKYDSQNEKPVLAAPDPAVLERLRGCCEAFDIEGADKAIVELESAEYETGGELIAWLREKITDSQFSEIVRKLG